ncbi:hypothetical protein ABBQ32_001483 [Trebouxia sp. C0010 RCD-2024]
MLDFHTTQLVAQKQALIVLLSGDADYNDVVDAARVAGHKVHLYHSQAVAQTLQGNVDHHEAWLTFLARKSGEAVEDLEHTGLMPRGPSPAAFKSAGTPALHRRVPHSHPGVKPIALQPQLAPTHHQATAHHCQSHTPASAPTQQPSSSLPGRAPAVAPSKSAGCQASSSAAQAEAASATWSTAQSEASSASRSAAQAEASSAGDSAAQSEKQASMQFGGQSWSDDPELQGRVASLEQPSKAPQDSGDSDQPQPLHKGPRASRHPLTAHVGQPPASQSTFQSATQPVVIMGQYRWHGSPSTSAYSGQPPGFANPSSDGRTVVVSGFRKGSAGPQARQQTLDMCGQFGDVSCCWLRKGKSSCWFTVVQFAEAERHSSNQKGGSVFSDWE